MRKLPFLNGIKAFEATARTGSFTKAAYELSVTPAAVSRMVHLLEERLGVALVDAEPDGDALGEPLGDAPPLAVPVGGDAEPVGDAEP